MVNDDRPAEPHAHAMWAYHPELLANAVPRYTSYPTAAEFHDNVRPADMARALDLVGEEEPLSLYLHIPYCREICWYCGCNTGAANRAGRLADYLDHLTKEIELVGRYLDRRGRVGRISFGGGSPNAISPSAFLRLVEAVRRNFDCTDAVVSVEIDPRGFDSEWSGALQDAGVSRVSLGVQTFEPRIQNAIGRVQPLQDVVSCVELLRRAGVASLNFDLMYGLPGQWTEDLLSTLRESVRLGADRLAVFGYAHVPNLIARQRRIDASSLPDAAARFGQARVAFEYLTGEGYAPIGFDHFARPGDPLAEAAARGLVRRNFQGFTDDQAETLIGLGATAISQFPGFLLQNEKNSGRYRIAIADGRFATSRGIARSEADLGRAHAIEAILSAGSADLAGLSDRDDIRVRLARFEARDLIEWDGWHLQLSPLALPYARTIAAQLDAFRQSTSGQFSNAI